jgi:hypothetical protein
LRPATRAGQKARATQRMASRTVSSTIITLSSEDKTPKTLPSLLVTLRLNCGVASEAKVLRSSVQKASDCLTDAPGLSRLRSRGLARRPVEPRQSGRQKSRCGGARRTTISPRTGDARFTTASSDCDDAFLGSGRRTLWLLTIRGKKPCLILSPPKTRAQSPSLHCPPRPPTTRSSTIRPLAGRRTAQRRLAHGAVVVESTGAP